LPRRKQKIKYSRKLACKHLTAKGDISSSLQTLCLCPERSLVLAPQAYVCQVCFLYEPTANLKISQVYEDSKKLAEKKIRDEKLELEAYEIDEIGKDEDVDLSIDEFEEDEEVPLKFEKRKAGKEDLEEGKELELECPFCGEVFDDLASHIQSCELAPDDASINDIMPTRSKKKRKRKPPKAKSKKSAPGKKAEADEEDDEDKEKNKCPYCGKEFLRLGRHLNACPKKPKDAE